MTYLTKIVIFTLATFGIGKAVSSQTAVLQADYPAAVELNKGAITQTATAPLVNPVTVSSLAELSVIAKGSGRIVKMTPGTYHMQDYLTPNVISAVEEDSYGRKAMILFSGSDNLFDFTGVEIEINTELLSKFGGNVIEFYVTGNNNHIKGLTVTDIGGFPTASGGQSMSVLGDNNKIENVTLNMSGSYPYGYGDLLGKGGGSLTSMKKHSGLLVSGMNDSIIGCTIISKSFGHLFFIQGGRNAYFENCYAEAVLRSTNDMLAETSGVAYNLNFEAVYKNYAGENVITPGYKKSLSECGFRTYGSGSGNTTSGVTLVNCKAVNCRIGFALGTEASPVVIKNCEALACEAGFNVAAVEMENCRGDATTGPLLYLSGDNSTVELDLIANVDTTILHAIATISGKNNVVTLNAFDDSIRSEENLIRIGSTRGGGSNPFSPLGTATTSGLTFNNYTKMPVELNAKVSTSTINSNGPVTNGGAGNTINIID